LNVAKEPRVFWNSPDLKSIYSYSFTNISVRNLLGKLGSDSSIDVLGFDSKLLCLASDVVF
jgi:hypothetical protein